MTKGSSGLLAVSLLVFPVSTSVFAPVFAAPARAPRTDCIQLAHAGGQDRPIGSVRMCPAKKAKREFQSALENKWSFLFDPTTFTRVRELVVHQKHEATPAGILPRGTFSLTWHEAGKVMDEDYTLEPASSCAFLDELANAAPGKEYGEFTGVLQDLKARVHCPAVTESAATGSAAAVPSK